MSLADRIEALRREHQRQAAPRAASRPALHTGGRYARWHVAETVEHESEGWLLTYLDLITLLLAIFVVLLGVAQLPKTSQAASAPVELVGTVAQAGGPSVAWADFAQTLSSETQGPSALVGAGGFMAVPPQALQAALVPLALAAPAGLAHHAGAAPVASLASQPALSPPVPLASTHAPRGVHAAQAESISGSYPAQAATPPSPEPAPPSIADLGLDDLGDGVDVIVNEKSISFRINNELLFPSGQAVLSPSGLQLIQRMAAVINRSQGYPVSVEGHSDPVPIQTRQFPSNWELSASRATSVLRELVRDGVNPARLRAVGYADTHPIAPNDTAAGRAANRRVELIMEITPQREAAANGDAAGQADTGPSQRVAAPDSARSSESVPASVDTRSR